MNTFPNSTTIHPARLGPPHLHIPRQYPPNRIYNARWQHRFRYQQNLGQVRLNITVIADDRDVSQMHTKLARRHPSTRPRCMLAHRNISLGFLCVEISNGCLVNRYSQDLLCWRNARCQICPVLPRSKYLRLAASVWKCKFTADRNVSLKRAKSRKDRGAKTGPPRAT